MTLPAKSRMQRLVIFGAVALALALLLLRLFVFVHGHGRHGAARKGYVSISSMPPAMDASSWTDSFGDGGQVTVRKSGNGITYGSAENNWYSADHKSSSKGNSR